MASLVLIVSVLFFIMLLVGPITIVLNKLLPKTLANILSIVCIIFGIWWITVVPTFIRWLGCLPIYCGYISWKK